MANDQTQPAADAAAQQKTLGESAGAYANADAAVKELEAKRAKLVQQLADLDNDIAAANKSRTDAHNALRGTV